MRRDREIDNLWIAYLFTADFNNGYGARDKDHGYSSAFSEPPIETVDTHQLTPPGVYDLDRELGAPRKKAVMPAGFPTRRQHADACRAFGARIPDICCPLMSPGRSHGRGSTTEFCSVLLPDVCIRLGITTLKDYWF